MNTLLTIVKFLPTLIALIKAVEEAIPGQGKGEQKLALVRELLQLVESNLDVSTVEKTVKALVATFNKTGW